MLADLLGKPLAGVVVVPDRARSEGAGRGRSPRASRRCSPSIPTSSACEGIGVVVPGMVEHSTMTRAARADARLAQRQPARAAGGRHRPAGADRELRPRLRAGAGVGAARRRRRRRRRPGVRQRLGRPRRRRHHQRRGAARPAQHRRRVRPRAAVARRPALLVRLERLLGSLRLEPRDAGALLRPADRTPTGPSDVDQHALHHRRPDRARARRRRQGGRRARGHRALSRAWAWRRSSTRSIRRASTSAAKSRWPGT